MSAKAKTNWFWSDWLGDQAVRRLTPAERGVWIDLLGLAAGGSPTGYVCDDRGRPLPLEEIARVTNAGSPDEVAKLINGIVEKGAASRDRTGRLFNRRMVRDAELSAKRSAAGQLGAAHTKLKWQGLQHLSQQSPQQLPRGLPQQRASPLIPSKITSTSRVAPREDGDPGPIPDFLRREPESGHPTGASGKSPSQVTRAEFDAAIEKRRGSAA